MAKKTLIACFCCLLYSLGTGATPECSDYILKKGYGKTRDAASKNADEQISKDISSALEGIYKDSLEQIMQGGVVQREKNISKNVAVLKVSFGGVKYIKQISEPYKDDGEWVSERYICKSDAAKPYLDSLSNINNQVGSKKISSSFCETLYTAYAPRVMSFEGLARDFGEGNSVQIDSYKQAKKECDDLRGSIRKGLVGFEEALDKAVAEISSKRGKINTKIVIAQIYAASNEVTDFITAELESKLVNVKNFAVGPAMIPNEQTKIGLMRDTDAMAIGKFSKANIVIVGSFKPFEGFSQFIIKALDVQGTKTLAMPTGRIRPDDDVLAGLVPDRLPAITDEALAYLNKGENLYREGKYDEAIRELDKALAINGNLADAYHFRGSAYFFKHNLDKDIEDQTAALRIKPNHYQALGSRGLAYNFKGYGDLAIDDFNAALRIKPDDHEILLNRGSAYSSKNNYDRAIEDYNTALRVKPDFSEALLTRGIAYYNKGNKDRAIEDYTAALKIKPDLYYALYQRGVVYFNNGNYDRAIEDYTATLNIKPDYILALNDRGVAYAIKGNLDRAVKDWEAVLRIDPNNANAKQNLEKARAMK